MASRPSVKEDICQPRSTTHFLEVQVHREYGAHTPTRSHATVSSTGYIISVQQTAVSSDQHASLQQQSAVTGIRTQHRAVNAKLTCPPGGRSKLRGQANVALSSAVYSVAVVRLSLRRSAPNEEFVIHFTGPSVISRRAFIGDGRSLRPPPVEERRVCLSQTCGSGPHHQEKSRG